MMITGYVVAVEDDPKDFQEYKGDRERNTTVEDPGGHIILFFPGTDYIKKHQAASAQQQNMVDRQECDKTVSRCENLRRRTEKEKSDINLFRAFSPTGSRRIYPKKGMGIIYRAAYSA